MVGAPGSGKSMMAKRLPSILPPLSLGESLETTKIHSVARLISPGCGKLPPPTIATWEIVWCGSRNGRWEINEDPRFSCLAHNGVLFLDELPEFNRGVLEVLRQPLEDRQITISRIKSTISYPVIGSGRQIEPFHSIFQ